MGVHFSDSNDTIFLSQLAFPNDGAGLDGNGDITLSFSTPQAWIGVHFPGFLTIEIFSAGQLVHSGDFGESGFGNFGGLVSSRPFDTAVLIDPFGLEAEIDDLHFGVPSGPTLALFALAMLRSPRRRKWSAS